MIAEALDNVTICLASVSTGVYVVPVCAFTDSVTTGSVNVLFVNVCVPVSDTKDVDDVVLVSVIFPDVMLVTLVPTNTVASEIELAGRLGAVGDAAGVPGTTWNATWFNDPV